MQSHILRMAGKRYRFYSNLRPKERSSLVDALKAGVWYEGVMLQYIRKRYGVGGNYIDIGAHLGTHSVFFAGPCRARRVIAFEPQLQLCDCMRQTFRANKITNVNLFEFGLGMKQRSQWITGYGSDFEASHKEMAGAEEMSIERFCDWVPNPPTIKLIKVDTDGMDIEALCSLRAVIERDRPVLVIESITEEAKAAVKSLLSPYGYKCGPVFNASPTFIWECTR